MGEGLIIAVVPITLVDLLWDKCVPHLNKFIQRSPDDLSLETIKANVYSGDQLISVVCEGPEIIAVLTFEVQYFDTGFKTLYVQGIGGDRLDEWAERMIDLIHIIAQDLECQEIRGSARPGWIRKLKQYDFEVAHTVLKCKVKPKQIKDGE